MRQPGPWRISLGTIHDRPRFAWRGAMLDVARHFFGVGEVKRLVDLMALYKLNRLHLHLTDDQGWRIAIRSWPRLTSHGSLTEVGGGPGGRFTQREYASIVAYARARFVEVVPEIDMPGHVNAALSSYASLNCNGVAPEPYSGIEVGFSSLCIRKELTYEFVDDVVRELAALTPGPYVHIGGDEADATDPGDYRTFVERVQAIVRSHGKRMIGWEEIAKAKLRKTSVAQHWHDPALARRAVEQGAKLIMSPATKAYLDMKYTSASPLGTTWAGTTTVRDAYAWDPAAQVPGVDDRRHSRGRGAASGPRRRPRAPSSTTSSSRGSWDTPRSGGRPPLDGPGGATSGVSRPTGRAFGRSASRSMRRPRCRGASA